VTSHLEEYAQVRSIVAIVPYAQREQARQEGFWFTLLGPVRGWLDGAELELGSPDQRAVLACLLLREGRPATAGEIIDAVWGEDAPRSVQGVLRTYVYRLRRLFSGLPGSDPLIQSVGGSYLLPVPDDTVDARVFQQRVEEGRRARLEGDPARAAVLLAEGLGWWQGTPLSGMRGPYADRQRQRLEQLYQSAREEYFAAEVERGAHREVIPALTQAVADSPLCERFRELLMLALYRAGRQAEALDVYQDAYRVLDEELGIAPGAALRDLHGAILRADPELELPADQDGQGPLAGPASVQLPPAIPQFTGRAAELAEITPLLSAAAGRPRLAGLTGLGGLGKSALAVQAARLLSGQFPGGQVYAQLGAGRATPADTAEVLAAFLRAAGVAPADLPAGLNERSAQWQAVLASREMLVVLDDVVDGEQARHLLPAAAGSAGLVSSDRRLPGLPGLSWIKVDAMTEEDSVLLLGAIAGMDRVAAEPGPARRLAAACSGQPLALGAAAARLLDRPSWSVAEIAAQLDDDLRNPLVMQDLRVLVDRPVERAQNRLDAPAAAAFRIMAVPDRDHLTAASAAAVLGLPEREALATLNRLAEVHLLTEGPAGIYRYQPPVRAYARRQALVVDGPERCRAALRDGADYVAADVPAPPRRPVTPAEPPADPGADGVVFRPDLVQRLGGPAQVSVISAPPGSGKTVLLRSWIAQARLEHGVAWVAAGPDDCDPQRFWLSVLTALRRTVAGSALVQEVTAAPELDGWAVVERLLRNLAVLRDPVWLVIDDVHELGPEVLRQLELLVLRAPPELRFVLATRQDLRLGLHRLRLAGGLAELRAADLRFSAGEAAELFASAGVRISGSAVALLHERTEGWAAGLRLAALSLAGHPDPERFAEEFSGSDRTVAEYLLAEVLDRQPEAVRRLLLRTSILERVNGKLADLLTGDDDGERVLQDLEEANAFVASLDGARSWFRYHPMFAELLALELRRTEAAQVTGLHQAASRWLAAHGFPVEAIRHAQGAEDWDRAARLLAGHWPSLHLDGQDAITHVLLAAFPPEVLAADAELAALIAADELAFGTLDEAERYLGLAEHAAGAVPPARLGQAQLLLGIVRLQVARQRGDLLAEAQEADRLRTMAAAPQAAVPALGEELRALALISLGYAEGWTAQSDPAGHLEQGIMLARRIGRSYLEFTGLAYQSAIEASRSLPGAEEHSRRAIELAEHHGWSDETAAGVAYTALGGVLAWQGRLDEAATWLDRAELAIKPEAEAVAALAVQYIRGQLLLARGQAADALATFEAAQRLAGRLAAPHPFARPARAWLVSALARLGQTERAEKFLARLDERERESGGIRIATAALRLAQQDPAGALAVLGPVLDYSVRVGWQSWLVEAFLLAAMARDALGEQAGAEGALERALDLAQPGGALLWFLLHPVPELLDSLRPGPAHADLIAEIKVQLAGNDGGIAARRAPARLTAPMSEAQLRVLRYLPTSLTVAEIADELFLSPSAVWTHLRQLYAKLGTHHRAEAVELARGLGLLAPSATSLSRSG
jgi:LuxR family transcriptional regulator, maltose regulon positive regulatory protein